VGKEYQRSLGRFSSFTLQGTQEFLSMSENAALVRGRKESRNVGIIPICENAHVREVLAKKISGPVESLWIRFRYCFRMGPCLSRMTLDAMDEHETVFELVLAHHTGIHGSNSAISSIPAECSDRTVIPSSRTVTVIL
jgi:hypothetical protein